MRKDKILITGGFGNIGSWLSLYFSEKYDVYILSKNIYKDLNFKYTLIHADITNLSELRLKLILEFDYCIHTASYNEFFHNNYAQKALSVNTLGTRNLIEVLKNTSIKNFVYLSTFHVYGKSSGFINEETDLNPKNDYASTHLFAEYYLRQFYNTDQFKSIIFRLTNSYGAPKSKNNSKWYLVLNDLVRSAYLDNKITLNGNGKVMRDFIWMGDVSTVIELSLINDQSGIFNLSSGITYSIFSLSQMVKHVFIKKYNKDIEIYINKNDKNKGLNLNVDNGKLLNKIDFKFQDKILEEIESIFHLLEKKEEKGESFE